MCGLRAQPGRARRGHETTPSDRAPGASEDSAEPPAASLPRPDRKPNSAPARKNVTPGTTSPTARRARSPFPRVPAAPPPHKLSRGSPFPLPWLQAPRGRTYRFALFPPSATRESAERGNKPKVTDLALQRAGAPATLAAVAASLGVPVRPPLYAPRAPRAGGRPLLPPRAAGWRLQCNSWSGPPGGGPTCALPSASPVGHGRQALSTARELFVSLPRLKHRRGWGGEAGLGSRGTALPGGSTPSAPTPPLHRPRTYGCAPPLVA